MPASRGGRSRQRDVRQPQPTLRWRPRLPGLRMGREQRAVRVEAVYPRSAVSERAHLHRRATQTRLQLGLVFLMGSSASHGVQRPVQFPVQITCRTSIVATLEVLKAYDGQDRSSPSCPRHVLPLNTRPLRSTSGSARESLGEDEEKLCLIVCVCSNDTCLCLCLCLDDRLKERFQGKHESVRGLIPFHLVRSQIADPDAAMGPTRSSACTRSTPAASSITASWGSLSALAKTAFASSSTGAGEFWSLAPEVTMRFCPQCQTSRSSQARLV